MQEENRTKWERQPEGIKNKDKSCGSGVTKVNQITVARKHAAPRMTNKHNELRNNKGKGNQTGDRSRPACKQIEHLDIITITRH